MITKQQQQEQEQEEQNNSEKAKQVNDNKPTLKKKSASELLQQKLQLMKQRKLQTLNKQHSSNVNKQIIQHNSDNVNGQFQQQSEQKSKMNENSKVRQLGTLENAERVESSKGKFQQLMAELRKKNEESLKINEVNSSELNKQDSEDNVENSQREQENGQISDARNEDQQRLNEIEKVDERIKHKQIGQEQNSNEDLTNKQMSEGIKLKLKQQIMKDMQDKLRMKEKLVEPKEDSEEEQNENEQKEVELKNQQIMNEQKDNQEVDEQEDEQEVEGKDKQINLLHHQSKEVTQKKEQWCWWQHPIVGKKNGLDQQNKKNSIKNKILLKEIYKITNLSKQLHKLVGKDGLKQKEHSMNLKEALSSVTSQLNVLQKLLQARKSCQ